jgi:hypothetical protein
MCTEIVLGYQAVLRVGRLMDEGMCTYRSYYCSYICSHACIFHVRIAFASYMLISIFDSK